MQMKNPIGSPEWTDPDDAPRLTPEMLENAEVFEGDKFVRRGRGRPVSGKAKEVISFRLDADVAAKLREKGPGWHSQVNTILRGLIDNATNPKAHELLVEALADFKEQRFADAQKKVETVVFQTRIMEEIGTLQQQNG